MPLATSTTSSEVRVALGELHPSLPCSKIAESVERSHSTPPCTDSSALCLLRLLLTVPKQEEVQAPLVGSTSSTNAEPIVATSQPAPVGGDVVAREPVPASSAGERAGCWQDIDPAIRAVTHWLTMSISSSSPVCPHRIPGRHGHWCREGRPWRCRSDGWRQRSEREG